MLTPPFHHLSTCHIITSNPSKHDAWQPHVGKAEGDWRGWIEGGEGAGGGVMTTRQHETHMLPHRIHPPPIFFISFMIVWRCGVQPTCRVVCLFILYFFHYCLTTWCATHMPCRLFFNFLFHLTTRCATHMPHRLSSYSLFLSLSFDDTVCNPHAVSFIFLFFISFDNAVCNPHAVFIFYFSFLSLLMTRCATHMPCCLFFISFIIVWRRGVQPTCCVVCFLFLLLLFDDVVCNPHAASFIFYFFHYCLMRQCLPIYF